MGIADSTDSVAGVVGWIDFENPDDRRHLERFAQHSKFLGLRPLIQEIPDDDWMLKPDIAWAYDAIIDLDLSFDALGFPRHMDNFLTICQRYPNLRVVLDHMLKPQIRNHSEASFNDWAGNMARLGETQAYCKLSGIITESQDDWTIDDLRPYVTHILDVFGPERVMWGSDWPVCLLRATYSEWLSIAQALTSECSETEKKMIFGGTAAMFYRV